jgi:hypothetical protein
MLGLAGNVGVPLAMLPAPHSRRELAQSPRTIWASVCARRLLSAMGTGLLEP